LPAAHPLHPTPSRGCLPSSPEMCLKISDWLPLKSCKPAIPSALNGKFREDQQKRDEWIERGFRYFNAPAVIIITSDSSLPETRPLLDIGGVMQTICLAALEFGLGTCIQNQGVMYPDILRKFAQIPATQRIIVAIAMGYPNWDFAANKVVSTREAVENMTTWCGF